MQGRSWLLLTVGKFQYSRHKTSATGTGTGTADAGAGAGAAGTRPGAPRPPFYAPAKSRAVHEFALARSHATATCLMALFIVGPCCFCPCLPDTSPTTHTLDTHRRYLNKLPKIQTLTIQKDHLLFEWNIHT